MHYKQQDERLTGPIIEIIARSVVNGQIDRPGRQIPQEKWPQSLIQPSDAILIQNHLPSTQHAPIQCRRLHHVNRPTGEAPLGLQLCFDHIEGASHDARSHAGAGPAERSHVHLGDSGGYDFEAGTEGRGGVRVYRARRGRTICMRNMLRLLRARSSSIAPREHLQPELNAACLAVLITKGSRTRAYRSSLRNPRALYKVKYKTRVFDRSQRNTASWGFGRGGTGFGRCG